MGKYPKNIWCPECGSNKFLALDKGWSRKDPIHGDKLVYWCTNEKVHEQIIFQKVIFKVNDKRKSIRLIVLYDKLPSW